MKDNAKTIGQVLYHTGVRDAIHVPIISAVAKEDLQPGAPVKLDADLGATASTQQASVGVVSPYLNDAVKQGCGFWVLIKPGSISTLTHSWTHKQIPDSVPQIPEKERARVRLEAFAEEKLSIPLEDMLEVIDNCSNGGDPLLNHRYESLGVPKGFWDDYETYTGKPDPNKASGCFYFFTCGGCS